ncbi:MAG: DNA-binding protein [Candidatus Thorarchaeota archaeon]
MTDDDVELAIIRRKKMAKLVAQERKDQRNKEQQEKVDVERGKLLNRYLAPDAQEYLQRIKTNEPAIGSRIEEIILHLIVYRGLRQTITQLDLRYVERQIKGEGPKIRIQRDGETSDFGTYVREAIKKNGEKGLND